MHDDQPLPIDRSELNGIRLRTRRQFVTSRQGAFLRRRQGQSLEYREHRAYAPGDDARYIDWRASERHGGPTDYLIRSFEAEEQFSLLVVIDDSATMRLPDSLSKLQVALWIAEAMATIAEFEKLAIAFALTSDGEATRFTRGAGIEASFSTFAKKVRSAEQVAGRGVEANAASVERLPQSSVTMLVSDLYCEGADLERLCGLVSAASRGARQVVVCELNSWPGERTMLAGEMIRLRDVGDHAAPPGEFEPSENELLAADSALRKHRDDVHRRLRGGGVVHTVWDMPDRLEAAVVAASFRGWFEEFLLASELFGRVR